MCFTKHYSLVATMPMSPMMQMINNAAGELLSLQDIKSQQLVKQKSLTAVIL